MYTCMYAGQEKQLGVGYLSVSLCKIKLIELLILSVYACMIIVMTGIYS